MEDTWSSINGQWFSIFRRMPCSSMGCRSTPWARFWLNVPFRFLRSEVHGCSVIRPQMRGTPRLSGSDCCRESQMLRASSCLSRSMEISDDSQHGGSFNSSPSRSRTVACLMTTKTWSTCSMRLNARLFHLHGGTGNGQPFSTKWCSSEHGENMRIVSVQTASWKLTLGSRYALDA